MVMFSAGENLHGHSLVCLDSEFRLMTFILGLRLNTVSCLKVEYVRFQK